MCTPLCRKITSGSENEHKRSVNIVIGVRIRQTNDTRTKIEHTITNGVSTDAGVGLGVEEVAQRDDHLLDLRGKFSRRSQNERLHMILGVVELLETSNGEGSRLSSSGLSLGDNVAATKNKTQKQEKIQNT
jgi:hypothetical protein